MRHVPFGPALPGGGEWWFLLDRLLPTLLFLALVGLAAWGVVRVTRDRPLPAGAGSGWSGERSRDAALREVRMRYARGEIDRTEFLTVARDLGAEIDESTSPRQAAGPPRGDPPTAPASGEEAPR